jgi:hypothetical protein
MNIYPSRAYGTLNQRDQASSIYLVPDEEPRKQFDFPGPNDPCPHC